jgi:succinoglycan biosynthesis protein ExoM
MNVAVCVITYQRPEGLRRLLGRLDDLSFEGHPPNLEVVVVDNDPAGSARSVCEEARQSLRWPIKYSIEPRRGIPFARNSAIARAEEGTDLIAFIDDDEVPRSTWLDELVRVQRSYGADAVYGSVLPYFNEEVPAWVIRGRFFEHPFVKAEYRTGQPLELADTNNVLIHAELLGKMGTLFDERLALTGGSDTHFFMRVSRAGYRIVWAGDATVYDWVPRSRATANWILQRAYRLGNMRSFCELDLEPSFAGPVMPVLKGCGRIVKGVAFVPVSLILGKHELVKALASVCYGAGRLAGVIGVQYKEYQRYFGE